MTTSKYEMPIISAMIKAAAPIIGGMSWPLVEAATSTAPAAWGLKPTFFINGIVMAPVVTVLAIEEPEMDPMAAEATTAAADAAEGEKGEDA